jgi:hypothetical protein
VVPNLVGDTEAGAAGRLASRGFVPVVTHAYSASVPEGSVIDQSPQPGTAMAPGPVEVTVSVGSGLTLRLASATMKAGTSQPVLVRAHGLEYQPLAPPPVEYMVEALLTPYMGNLPEVMSGLLYAPPDTRGAFRVTATDVATGRRVTVDVAVTHPGPSDGSPTMNDSYAAVSRAMADIDDLARQGRIALAADDEAAMRSLLEQMVARWRTVDLRELSLATPLGLERGFFPTLQDLPVLGLSPTADDLLAQAVLADAAADLQAWITGLRAPDTSMAELRSLARRFRSRAARLEGLTISEWGAIRAQSVLAVLANDRLPQLYSALMSDLEEALTSQPATGSAIPAGLAAFPATLGEQVVRTAMEYVVEEIMERASETYRSARQVVADTLKFAAFGAATVAAAHHFRDYVQATDLTAVVAGASLSFRFFEKEFSFIETAVDPEYAENNIVIAIGPDVMQPVADFVEGIQGAWSYRRPLGLAAQAQSADQLFTTLQGLYHALTTLGENTEALAETARNAFQPTAEVLRGCVFTTDPACGQLFYRDGLASVYHYSPPPTPGFQDFTGFPVPILFMVYDRTTGAMSIETPVFFPTIGQ